MIRKSNLGLSIAIRDAPDFFTSQIIYVVQDQLGLKLSPAQGPMESLVVDHPEAPSEN